MIAIVSAALLAIGARDPDPILAKLRAGLAVDEVKKAASALGLEGAKWLRQGEPQALAEGLVRSKLLETLNALKLAPVDAGGALDPSALRELMTAKRSDRAYVAAFGEKGLRFLLARIPVPVDQAGEADRGGSRERLHRLREALDEIGRTVAPLSASKKDRYGNAFEWSGRGVRALYLPADDELRVLVSDR
jgi:hypothetical protein